MVRSLDEVCPHLGGLLPFVHTPFGADGAPDLPRLRQHLRWLAAGHPDRPACYFVACGTGEFWSLGLDEYRAVVTAAVDEVGGRVPVVVGVGYGTSLAFEFVRAAEVAGADALLVFPPYLVGGPQEGLYRHYAALAAATDRAVLIYNRDNAVFVAATVARLAAAHPNIIGVKDGYGDLGLLAEMRRLLGEGFLLMNGMPTAELYAPSYLRAGIRPYSPSAIEFLPELAWVYDHALARGDATLVERLSAAFYRPYQALRSLVPGYGIALTKAALALRGMPSGGVRPPLVEASPEHVAMLADLIARGLELAATHQGG
ncbi:MAG: 5-dehydro-4-deoxyglucarate dehydratase [Chloroflexota bacterium]